MRLFVIRITHPKRIPLIAAMPVVRVASLMAFLLGAAFFVGAQPPIGPAVPNPTIPNGSLARAYQFEALERPSDFNKSHIRVLVLRNARNEAVGLKVAGHSEADICRQATETVVKVAQALDAQNIPFGPIGRPQAAFYVSYGIFEGPIGEAYKRPYTEAATAFAALASAHPGKVVLREMRQAEFEACLARLDTTRNASLRQEGAVVGLHQFPEPFMAFVRQGGLQAGDFQPLVAQVKQAATREYMARLRQDEQSLLVVVRQVQKLKMPSRFRMAPMRYPPDNLRNQPEDAQRRRLQAVVQRAMAMPATAMALNENRQVLAQVRQMANALNDDYMKRILASWADAAEKTLSPDTLRLYLLRQLPPLEREQQMLADSLFLEFAPVENDPLRDLVERFVTAQRAFLQFAEGLAAHHPYMLADAIVRGWPVLNPEEFNALFQQGTRLRTPAGFYSQYNFLAPDNARETTGGASAFVSVSGAVAQICNNGECSYLAPEDFMQHHWEVPHLAEILHGFMEAGLADSTLRLFWSTPEGHNNTPTTVQAFLASPNLQSLPRNFFTQDPDSQALWLAQAVPGAKPLGPGANGYWVPGTGNSPTGVLVFDEHSPFDPYAGSVVFHALRRLSLDPDLDRSLGVNLVVPDPRFSRVPGAQWARAMWLQLPTGCRPLAEWAHAEPARRRAFTDLYLKFQFEMARRLGNDIPSALPLNSGENWYRNTLQTLATNWRRAQGPAMASAQAWRELAEFLRDLAAFSGDLAGTEYTVMQHNPDARSLFVSADAKTIFITNATQDQRLHHGAHFAQTWLQALVLEHTDAHPLTATQLQATWDATIRQAQQTGYLVPEALKSAPFLAASIMGLWNAGGLLGSRRGMLPPTHAAVLAIDKRLLNIHQPALRFLLQKATQQSLPERLGFILRNLNTVLQDFGDGTVYGG